MKHFLLFGTHPELSLAEARAVLGKGIEPWMGSMGLIESPAFDGDAMQERLAGVVKLGEVVSEIETSDVSTLAAQIADQIEARPRADRVLFGLTLAGTPKDKDNFKKLPIELKRALQGRGRSVRWVTGDNGNISPAAISKLALTTEGYDFVIAIDKKKIAICLTTNSSGGRWQGTGGQMSVCSARARYSGRLSRPHSYWRTTGRSARTCIR